jgi:formylglycine-generating enzyme required for sulfatase activity
VIANLIAGLAVMGLSPAAFQAAILQKPTASLAQPGSDIRIVQRQTTDAEALQMQPPPGMVFVTGGQVLVGSDAVKVPEYGQNDITQMTEVLAETPRHAATVGQFFIDTTEVTNLQWKVFLEATGRKPSATLVSFNWPNGQIPEGQEHFPVTNVNFPEIRDYLVWSGQRLPTEYEWTRAARGDDERTYPWGAKWDSKLCQSGQNIPPGPVQVGSYPGGASPFGALDMTGNVLEWVDGPFSAFPGFEAYEFKQGRKTAMLSPEFDSARKVIKGGGYLGTRNVMRIDSRMGLDANGSDQTLGFRCARSTMAGLEAVRHGYKRLLPPQFARTPLDEKDIFGKEVTFYDDQQRVITGYRSLSFAHRAAERGKSLAGVRKDSVDAPFPLGVLVTTESLLMPDMREAKTRKVQAIPAGEYTLCFKGKGESKAWKAKQRTGKDEKPTASVDEEKDKKDKSKGKGKGKQDEPEEPVEDESSGLLAVAPWPGVGSIHDIAEDIDFPQDKDVILFFNASNVVVAWQMVEEVREVDVAPIAARAEEGGKVWTIEFSIDQVAGKSPRFSLPMHLAGEPLAP